MTRNKSPILSSHEKLMKVLLYPNSEEIIIVGIDPTFYLGVFSITESTYHHLQLFLLNLQKHPVLLGPKLIIIIKPYNFIILWHQTWLNLAQS